MKDAPKVSIITPSFNRAALIQETAESVFNQTYQNWEWIVVDDGSTDDTSKIFEVYMKKDSRVKFFHRSNETKGACSCRNIGVKYSDGEYLIFLDSDDLLSNICLEQRIIAISNNLNKDFWIFPMLMFNKYPSDLNILWNIDKEVNDISRILFGDAICQGTAILWSKSSFVQLGMWNETLQVWQDVELHLRALVLGLKYSKCFESIPDVYIRINENSISRTSFQSLAKLQSRVHVFLSIFTLAKVNNKVTENFDGFKYMFVDIVISSLQSNQWEEFEKLLNFIESESLIKYKERYWMKVYKNFRKLKLYKLKHLDNFIYRKLKKGIKCDIDITLGKIFFQAPA